MSVCSHCKGTGIGPDTIKLECITCQRPVTVTYLDGDDLRAKCENVRCADCKKYVRATTQQPEKEPTA